MKKLFKGVALLITSISLVFGLAACSPETTDMSKVTAVIDVRTPAEFAEGHLQGALNIDVEAGDFASKIATLDKSGNYLIYCHSGRRAGIAKDQMAAAGFMSVTNAGGIADAAALTGLAIVQ